MNTAIPKPCQKYKSIELFAGGGGLALGLELAGFEAVLLNEKNKTACETLRQNRPHWNVVEGSVEKLDFSQHNGTIDLVSGGFPCQAFSTAGQQLGFADVRGTMFFEYARAVKEIQPKIFVAENVKGLLKHDGGKTLNTIKAVIAEIGYTLINPEVLKAVCYNVPQKRERIFLIAVRNDLAKNINFEWPTPSDKVLTLKDALQAGDLYSCNVPDSIGPGYLPRKKEIMAMVPPGGDWRNLPVDIQKEYMKNYFYSSGGRTGVARRLSWDKPCPTLTCSPAQTQTEYCHPAEVRPLAVREFARIQTFPDSWGFCGSMTAQYTQIGNAVPVNLAFLIGKSLIKLLNNINNDK